MSEFARFERMGERLAASLRPPEEADEGPSPEDAILDRADAALAKLGRQAGDLAARARAGVPGDLAKLDALADALEALLAPRG